MKGKFLVLAVLVLHPAYQLQVQGKSVLQIFSHSIDFYWGNATAEESLCGLFSLRVKDVVQVFETFNDKPFFFNEPKALVKRE